MSQFDTDFVAAAAEDLLARYGEDITYTPKGAAALSRKAIIVRQKAGAIPGTVQGFAPYVDLYVARDATLGVATITKGGDALTFPPSVPGGTTATYRAPDAVVDGPWWHFRIHTG